MDFEELVQTRRSVRGFKKRPVPRAVRDHRGRQARAFVDAEIPDDQVIMTCVALSYPDDSFPANGVRSDRKPHADFVRHVGFTD